jgi:hypothetical protein
MLNQYLGFSEVLSLQRYALGSLHYNLTKLERIIQKIEAEIIGTTWTEEPRPLPKRRLRGPGRLRYPVEAELASSWWAARARRSGK